MAEENEELISGIESLSSILNDLVKEIKEGKTTLGTTDFSEVSAKNARASLETLLSLSTEASDMAKKDLELLNKKLTVLEDQASILNYQNNLIQKQKDYAMDLFSRLEDWISHIPGGSFILAHIGVDEIKKSLEENIIQTLRQGTLDIGSLVNITTLSISKMIGAAGQALKSLLFNPVFLFIAVGALFLKRFVDLNQTAKELRTTTGLIGDELNKASKQTEQINAETRRYGVSLEQAASSVTALVDEFGTLDMITDEAAKGVSILTATMGLSAEEGAKLYKTMGLTAGSTRETADEMTSMLVQMAKSAKVPIGTVMKDVASSSERIFEFTSGTPEVIAKTAIEARRLGTNLDRVASIAESLLDFESSIENEMSAMVLTGMQLNLNQARLHAVMGETDKILPSILGQFGSLEEISSLLPYQQKALAQAIGLSVGELRDMVQRQEDLDKLSSGTLSTYKAFEKGRSLDEVLGTAGVLTPLERISNSFQSIIVSLSRVLMPLIGPLSMALESVAWVLDLVGSGVSFVTDMFGKFFGELGVGANLLSIVFVGAIIVASKKLLGVIGKMGKGIGNFVSGISRGVGEGIKNFFSAFGSINPIAILKGALALAVLGGSLFIIGKSMKVFDDVDWTNVLFGVGVLTALTIGVAILGAMIAGPGAIIFGAGILGLLALGGALAVVGAGAKVFGEGMEIISDSLSSIVSDLKELIGISSELSSIADVLDQLGEAFYGFGVGVEAANIGGIGIAQRVTQEVTATPPVATIVHEANQLQNAANEPTINIEESESNKEIIKKLDEVIAAIEGEKITTVKMDSNKLIEGIAKNSKR